ncbi:hypothetical protein DLAC_01336 [Tieghemostelium lacteum]|uniref:MACPF domain-containing protein n=1 Tax=Tieghemostelium lacteum TaxID=361077 RepID=A0A152A8E6_TIELA|nr:hypothetical protein DLAC_01336 [Tieghemostelium lacteum]|eukprot:KYR02492.1 hypothetical protein DLAC_01336 [Tieghemostelium lacteum]
MVFNSTTKLFRSTNGFQNTIIDCENNTFAFYVVNSKVTFDGITIKNCKSIYGGAIRSQDSTLALKNMNFESNSAMYGGAIYSSSKQITINASTFKGNYAIKSGGALYAYYATVQIQNGTKFQCNALTGPYGGRNEIYCDKSKISVDDSIQIQNLGFTCSKTCSVYRTSSPSKSLCFNVASNTGCLPTGGNGNNSTDPTDPNSGQTCSSFENPGPSKVVIDGVCNPLYENCLNNPADCKSCYFSGVYLQSNNNGTVDYEVYPTLNIKNFNDIILDSKTYTGAVKSYLKVDETGYYSFTTIGNNIGVKMTLNRQIIVNSYFQQTFSNSTDSFYLEKDKIQTLYAEIVVSDLTRPISLSVIVKFPSNPSKELQPFFYSRNICGDGIYDSEEELTCPSDKEYSNKIIGQSGKETCQSSDPNMDFSKCYSVLTKTCPTRQVADGFMSPGFFYTQDDMLGNLIANQFIWHLPGSEHMSFAIDITDGQEAKAPLFYFSYCDSKATRLVEDVYRASTYDLPDELFGKALPECKFSTETKFHSDTQSMSSEMQEKTTRQYALSVGGGTAFISGEASVSFQNEKTVEKARSMKKSVSETFITTSLYCTTSVIELNDNKYSFHPLFLENLSKARNINQMILVIEKYGTHFYKKAVMGGRLSTVAVATMTSSEQSERDAWQESTARSFSASISAPVFKASVEVSETTDSTLDTNSQQTMQDESTRSTVITYGGPLGAYGPTSGYENSNFQKWSQGVDLAPIPVDYDLAPIRSIINKNWKVGNSTMLVLELWEKAEIEYYRRKMRTSGLGDSNQFAHSLYVNFNTNAVDKEFLPILDIEWIYKSPISQVREVVKETIILPMIFVDADGNIVEFADVLQNTYRESQVNMNYKGRTSNMEDTTNFNGFPGLEEDDWTTCSGWDTKDKHWCFKFSYLNTEINAIKENVLHVFHFNAPNFFELHDSTAGNPKFTLHNMAAVVGDVKLISWANGEGVILNNIGGLVSNSNGYATVHYTRYYSKLPIKFWQDRYLGNSGSDQEDIFNDCLEGRTFDKYCWGNYSGDGNHGNLLICCIQTITKQTYGTLVRDYEKFVYKIGNGQLTHYYTVKQDDNTNKFWGDFVTSSPSNTIQTAHEIVFGSKTLLNWALMFEASNGWKRSIKVWNSAWDITYYDANSQSYSIPSIYIK